MFWRYNRPWNAFNKFVIVFYITLGTAFATILKRLCYLKNGVFFFFFFFFFAQYLRFMVRKIGPDGNKRRKGSLASGKTLVWPISSHFLSAPPPLTDTIFFSHIVRFYIHFYLQIYNILDKKFCMYVCW